MINYSKIKADNPKAIAELRKFFPQLPDNLTVGGSLNLRGTQITQLPDNLTVGGYLYLSGTQITQLPDNLTVGGYLYLRGTQIKSSDRFIISEEIGSRQDRTTYDIKKDLVFCGCFRGTFLQFKKQVYATYKQGSQYRSEYDNYIELILNSMENNL